LNSYEDFNSPIRKKINYKDVMKNKRYKSTMEYLSEQNKQNATLKKSSTNFELTENTHFAEDNKKKINYQNVNARGSYRGNYMEYKSTEINSSTKSQTFSEIEKQYNHLIEKALDVSISNKAFSKMSSLRTNYVGNLMGKFGSERTNTVFQNEIKLKSVEREKLKNKEIANRFKARISPILG
jgi:hypothetical protein